METAEAAQKFAMFDGMDAIRLSHEMKGLQAEMFVLEGQLKDMQAKLDFLRFTKIPAAFEERGIENMRVEGVGTVYLSSDLHASIKGGCKPAAFDWLRDTGHGDLIQEQVHPSSLKAACKEMLQKGEEIPTELFNVSPFTRAAIKAK